MNDNRKLHIKRLLELYYEGKSSATDEAELRDYFNSPDADPEFETDRAIFAAISGNDNVEVPKDLETRLSDAIDSWERAGRIAPPKQTWFRIKPLRVISGIAATVAVFLALGALLFPKTPTQPVDTFTDPMDAYAETMRVLDLFANTLDKSLQGLQVAERTQERALDITLKQLDNL